MQSPDAIDAKLFHVGLFLIRLIFGLVFAAHGAQKLFGWFGGYGLGGTGEWMASIGFRPGKPFAAGAGFGEFVGGLLFALGFLSPIGSALMLSVMVVATWTVHRKNGLFATNNGIELPLLFGTAAVGIALTGPGRYSLDAVLGNHVLLSPSVTWIVLGIGLLGGIANLALRRPSDPKPSV